MAITTVLLSQEAGLNQIIQKCDSQLLSIASSMSEQETALAARASELETIAARASAREQNLHIAGQSVAVVKEELAQLRKRVELAEGTLSSDNSADQIRTLEKKLLRLESEEHSLRTKLAKEATADATRETAIWTAIHQAQEAIASLTQEQQATNAAREQTYQDLGIAKKQAVMSRLKELHENITRTRTEAASALQALDAYADEAVRTLNEWPALQSQIQPFLPAHKDASTQLLEAQISLLSVLLNNGAVANIDSFLVSETLGKFAALEAVLSLDERYVAVALRGGDMQSLRERYEQAEKLLSAYRASKQHTSPVVGSVQAKRQRW